jgi:hypothetical protein
MEFKTCPKKSATFVVAIFMKFTDYRQHYVRVSYTEYRASGTINVETAGRISFTPLGEV